VTKLRTALHMRRLVAVSMIMILAVLFVKLDLTVKAQSSTEYGRYVHNYSNWTYVEKPMFPVLFNESQILTGQNWSIVCPLTANQSYHVYFYGAWVNEGSEPKTDYDIYVYDPSSRLEAKHTASAGLPEHLGSAGNEPLFVPKSTGNYTFVIVNDPAESMGTQKATFMIVENVECNVWQSHYVEGKSGSLPVLYTSWAYEFMTESQYVEVLVKVPQSLDMYEARLYLMADPTSPDYTLLNGVPLAWEPGLYGNRSGVNNMLGGYNLDSEGYRGVGYASCESFGQSMFLNFTSPHSGKNLYHLVLIGEKGAGTVEFLIKTALDVGLVPSIVPGKVYLDSNATVAYTSKSTDLLNATLTFSTDGWRTSSAVAMDITNSSRTCRASIPHQAGGAFVSYRVEAHDLLDNVLVAGGNYTVRLPSTSYIAKPMVPVFFSDSQIDIGEDWSVVCSLRANHSYHVYLYGAWVNSGSEPKTDYDIYVYDPEGTLESSHTEAAGLLEHLGTTVNDAFFVPKSTGNYTFIVSNDPRESKGAQQATFMIVEDVECNVWHEHYTEGKGSDSLPVFDTSWTYEFVTDSQRVEVWIKVPQSLDMYEARLYLMADPTSPNYTLLNGVPLAWEPGLYGNRNGANGIFGGYNLDSWGYRGVAYASCEFFGQNMFLNFTSPHLGRSLYHLVLIGEKGNGTIRFLVKTVFDASLQPSIVPGKVYLNSNATIAYISVSTDLVNATLQYSIDGWRTSVAIHMDVSNGSRTCMGLISGQSGGTFVSYMVEARDLLENVLVARGNYTVRHALTSFVEKPMVPVFFSDSQIDIGEDWSVACLLRANHSYHVYFYGAWVNNGSEPKTDYDIYVYNPQGILESSHTASAGLLEHLGTTTDLPFFVPSYTGNYTFIIVNEASDSMGARQATFMIVENVECNVWRSHYVEGKSGSQPAFNTSWAYEFVTDSQRVEVSVRVPQSLDMYEVRLYLMADPSSQNYTLLDDIPLAWEPGLYGNRSGAGGMFGGYNMDSDAYRGVAYASCEFFGQSMLLGFTSPHSGRSLYHLVLIGEFGSGNVEFRVKTIFDVGLLPSSVPSKVYPEDDTAIAYVSKSTDLVNATLRYSADGWNNATVVGMDIFGNRTCTATIPKQAPGTLVNYRVEANDFLENVLVATGNYSVRRNSTFLEKPVSPVLFNDSDIETGRNWSIVTPLMANRTYHVYCYGKWVNNGSEPKTNYDVFVYDPYGNLEGYHAASAGLPERLGTTVDDAFFVPKFTGNYTFIIANEGGAGMQAEQATFMIVEDVECNVWRGHYVEGKNGSQPVFNTTWAYEFVSESQHVEILIDVPQSLAMYEARLYLNADPTSKNYSLLNDVPLAWEPGLYGNRSGEGGILGGYNLDSEGYRGVAYAGCEYPGQSMFLNFTSPHSGKSLYHLVLIGERGAGTVEFLVKTVFDASLLPSITPGKVYPNSDATVAYVSKSTDLVNATLQYSTDGWKNVTTVKMEIVDDRTCRATVPGQNFGTSVVYGIEASDVMRNVLTANGSYPVKRPSSFNVSLTREAVSLGENITVQGYLTSRVAGLPITIYFEFGNESGSIDCYTVENGVFTGSFRPEAVGIWSVQAVFFEDGLTYGTVGPQLTIEVQEPSFLAKYSLYIGIGVGGGVAAVAVVMVYLKKWRTAGPEEEW